MRTSQALPAKVAGGPTFVTDAAIASAADRVGHLFYNRGLRARTALRDP
jgi:hypothetical protein